MTEIPVEAYARWKPGDDTCHAPYDVSFLEAATEAGFVAFTGPIGLFGATSGQRTVLIIHRGRGIKWEITFRKNNVNVDAWTNDLKRTTNTVLNFLRGGNIGHG